MIVTLELSTARLRTLLAEAHVRLDEDATLRFEADPDEHWIGCAKVDGTVRYTRRGDRLRDVAPKDGYL